jgi:hypothetical protein
MDKSFLLAFIITAFFGLSKYVELRFLTDEEDEPKPLKEIVRDLLVVLVCSISGSFLFFHFQQNLMDFFNVVTETKVLNAATTQIFTDVPAF